MNSLLNKITQTFGVSGREDKVREVIEEKIKELGLNPVTDNMGNVVVNISQGKTKEKYLISANMDTIGVIVTFIEDNGFLRVGALGDFEAYKVANRLVVFQNGVVGRCCLTKREGNVDDMYIDIGATSRESALTLVREGDTAAFKGESSFQGKMIIGPNLSNRIGTCIILKALENLVEKKALDKISKDMTIAFTTQKNLSHRGARVLTHTVAPDKVLVLDVEEAGDTIEGKGPLKLGKGLGLKVMDGNLILHHEMKEELKAISNNDLINIVSDKPTDGGILQKEGKGAKVGVVAVPCRYTHTSEEVMSMEDIEQGVQLLEKYLLA